MLKISPSGDIELTRGDSALFQVDIRNDETGEAYVMKPTEELTMTISSTVYEEGYLLQKTAIGTNIIEFKPIDTSNMEYGTYKYDVQLTTNSKDVFTVVPPSNFKLAYEVTK